MSSKKVAKKNKLFVNDLKSLLYAFGDSTMPNVETIHALEDVLTTYLLDVVTSANLARQSQGRHKMKVEDLQFALRNDPTKLGRINELMKMDKEISNAKKMFDEVEKGSKKRVADDKTGKPKKRKK